MTPKQAAIERLRELENHVLPLNWQVDEANEENIVDANGLFVAETCSDDDAALIVALRNEALPLIEALAAENERLRGGIGKAVEYLQHQFGYDDVLALEQEFRQISFGDVTEFMDFMKKLEALQNDA